MINEFGLELELDQWVIEHTFSALKAQVEDWNLVGRCAINLTAKALNYEGMAEDIQAEARLHHIPMDKLCFEITDSRMRCAMNPSLFTISIFFAHRGRPSHWTTLVPDTPVLTIYVASHWMCSKLMALL
ncbi:EAL domain-containing protein [Vibrio harveyi]|nr:EAL domain-containing protein [Vibrio harveyi]